MFSMTRRRFLETMAVAALPACSTTGIRALRAPVAVDLVAQAGRVPLVGAPHPHTDVWCFNGTVPGPVIRARQGERLRVAVTNRLDETTTVHWHGVRVPNAMDGVPGLTQPPIAAGGGTFVYEFDLPDAGTYWYHPHSRSYEQVDRGLYGALVVEERADERTWDRDETWVLDDWRLRRDAAIADDFLHPRDTSHDGRIGNTVTVNGAIPERFELRAGERVRLRLANVANARIFGLRFDGHKPLVIAYDGHPVEPHEPANGTVVLGASQRVDLLIDASAQPGSKHVVRDVYYPRQAYRLLDLAYRDEAPLPPRPPVRALPPNPLPEPDLDRARVHEIRITGGAPEQPMWAINGVAVKGEDHLHHPLMEMRRDSSVVLDFRNLTAWPHPMHLHGHAFRVLTRNGKPNPLREWRDTVLLAARESATVAFVADNPGDWMLHCHVLEHQAAGMMATFRVA